MACLAFALKPLQSGIDGIEAANGRPEPAGDGSGEADGATAARCALDTGAAIVIARATLWTLRHCLDQLRLLGRIREHAVDAHRSTRSISAEPAHRSLWKGYRGAKNQPDSMTKSLAIRAMMTWERLASIMTYHPSPA